MDSQDLDCLIDFKVGNYQWILKTLIASSATQSRELPVDFQTLIASSATQSRELLVDSQDLDCLIGDSK